jgi:hypothetical protein
LQHLCSKHNNGINAIFCSSLVNFSLVPYFWPRKQICIFFFPYNYGSFQI